MRERERESYILQSRWPTFLFINLMKVHSFFILIFLSDSSKYHISEYYNLKNMFFNLRYKVYLTYSKNVEI